MGKIPLLFFTIFHEITIVPATVVCTGFKLMSPLLPEAAILCQLKNKQEHLILSVL